MQECKDRGVKFKNGMIPWIYSYNTYNAYKQASMEFINYLRKNNVKPRYLTDITKKQAINYLQYKQNNNYSSYSIDKDVAAINKIWNFGITKKNGGLKQKSLKQITRSREPRTMDKNYNPELYKEQILVARSFGLRRECVLKIKEHSIFKKDNKIYCSIIGKGGRYREAPCLKKFEKDVLNTFNPIERDSLQVGYSYNSKTDYYFPSYNKQAFKEYYNSPDAGDYLFSTYSHNIDNHAFRRDYAQELYREILEQQGQVAEQYTKFDKDIVLEVSNALGHSRIDVVINRYLK